MSANESIDLNRLLSDEEIDPKWLSLDFNTTPPRPPPPADSQTDAVADADADADAVAVAVAGPSNPAIHSHSSRPRRNPTHANNKETIPPPFPWATNLHATIHTLEYLFTNGLTAIKGDVQCRWCEHKDSVSFDLPSKFAEVRSFVMSQYHEMHDRAPERWKSPAFDDCGACGQHNCMRPVIPDERERINWLFLFLGQMLGCCTLEQLKYFCMHTQNHRTGAKDRVLFLAYITICKQLDPDVFH